MTHKTINASLLLLERPRLLNTLRQALQHKLTIITAPPGYGKTTLISQFVAELQIPVAWQTLNETDCDVPNLYANSLHALAKLVPNIQSLSPPPQSTSSELAKNITGYLQQNLQEDCLYILDDAHYMLGSRAGELWLHTLVTTLPTNCHLIIASRVLPNLPLTQMIARRQVLAIGQSQLRFTVEEIELLAHCSNLKLTPQDFHRLIVQLEGWPAGVVLVLHPLPAEFEQAVFDGQSGPETLFDRLAQYLLQSQPTPLRRFLLTSSTLTRLTPDLCEMVLRLPNSAAYLDQVRKHNLFVSPIAGGLTYHALFRDLLQRELQTWNSRLFIQLHVQAGEWFADHNQPDEAINHFITAKAWDKAVEIVERVVSSYFAQGRIETVLRWGQLMLATELPIPRLYYTCAMIYTDRYQYDQAVIALTKAATGFQTEGNAVGLLEVELLQASLENQRGDYQVAANRAEALLNHPALPSNLHGYALVTLGYAMLQLGNPQTALTHLETALPTYRAAGDVYAILQLLHHLELTHIRLGQFDKAGHYIQEIVATHRRLGSGMSFALALNDLGYYHHQMGMYETAFDNFQEGLQITRRIAQPRVESGLLWSLGDLQRDRGAFEEAAQIYLRALELIGEREPALQCGVLNSLAVLRRWQGQNEDAYHLATEAYGLADRSQIALERLKAGITLWVIEAQQNLTAIQWQNWEVLVDSFSQQQAHTRLAQARILGAYIALLEQDTAKAFRLVELICQPMVHSNTLQPALAEIQHYPPLRDFVIQHCSRYPAIKEGLQQIRAAQIPPNVADEPTTPFQTFSLRVYTLGREKVERDGLPIPNSAWRWSARKLFYYLLFKRSITREQIGLEFWPDNDSHQLRQIFHTTLHRVRQAVGENVILFQDNLYQIHPDVDVYCDAFEFETTIKEARLLAPRTPQAEYLWHRAVNLYQGDFLPELEADWADAYREMLRELYIESLIGVATCARVRGSFTEAIASLKQAISVDPYREDIYRLIFTCYSESGERTLLRQAYDELCALFTHELAAKPSSETQLLVQALLL